MRIFAAAIGVLAGLVPMNAQVFYQYFGTNANGTRPIDEGFLSNQVVKGKPFAATEERHSLQILGDGTRIESSQSSRLFRDSEGRTRVEEPGGTVTIFDPVAGFRAELIPSTKTAHKSMATVNAFNLGRSGGRAGRGGEGALQLIREQLQQLQERMNPQNGVMTETTENLGSQTVNGIMAQGVRTTMTIPKGQIGNDRPIKVLTERWFSDDLQTLVKSINSDPRFGDTTYQLTRIPGRVPEAGLFQIPGDYAVEPSPDLLLLRRPVSPKSAN